MSVCIVQRLFELQVDGVLQTILLRDNYQQWGKEFRDLLIPLSVPPASSAPYSLSTSSSTSASLPSFSSLPSSTSAPSFFLTLLDPSSSSSPPRQTKAVPMQRQSSVPQLGLALSTPAPTPSRTHPLFEFRLFRRFDDTGRSVEAEERQLDTGSGLLELQLRDLHLMVNQETMLVLIKFVNSNVLRPLKRARPDGELSPSAAASPPPPPSPLHVVASLGCIKFTLNHGGHHLAEGYLDRSRFEVFSEPHATRVEANVGHLKLLDLASAFASTADNTPAASDPAAIRAFQEVIMIQGATDALTFTLKLARPGCTAGPSSMVAGGSSLYMSVTGVKILLVHHFFARLLGYAAELRSLIAPYSAAVSSPDTSGDQPFRYVSRLSYHHIPLSLTLMNTSGCRSM